MCVLYMYIYIYTPRDHGAEVATRSRGRSCGAVSFVLDEPEDIKTTSHDVQTLASWMRLGF